MLKLPDLYQVIFNAGNAELLYETFRKRCLQNFFVQTYCYDPKGEKDYSAGIRYHHGWDTYREYLEDLFRTIPDGVGVCMNERIDDSREDSIVVVVDYVYTGTFVCMSSHLMPVQSNSFNNFAGGLQVALSSKLSQNQVTRSSILSQFVTVEESKKLNSTSAQETKAHIIDTTGNFNIYIDRKTRLITMFEFKYQVDENDSLFQQHK